MNWKIVKKTACAGLLAAVVAGAFSLAGRHATGQNGAGGVALPAPALFQENPKSRAERLIEGSIRSLENLGSFSADFEFEARFFGERYYGRGRYEEMNVRRARSSASAVSPLDANRFLLHASFPKGAGSVADQSGSDENSLDVVCDTERRTWWRFSSIEGNNSLLQLNIDELGVALSQLDDHETRRLIDSGVDHACGMSGMPGLGGLPGVLKRLKANYLFDPEPAPVSSPGGVETYRLTGTARECFWAEVRRNLGETEISDDILENLPTKVEIYFGADWAFPAKIAYYRADSRSKSDGDSLMFSVSYSSAVRNDATVTGAHFNYAQPQINSERYDEDYLESLVGGDGSE